MSKTKSRSEAKFVFVSEGRIVATAETIIEAIKAARANPDAVVYESSYWGSVDALKRRRQHEIGEKRLKPNPLGKILHREVEGLIDNVEEVIGEIIPGTDVGSFWGLGLVTEDYKARRATNEECAVFNDFINLDFRFDIRKNIPAQFSRFLAKTAKLLERASVAVGLLKDPRNLSLMRRCVDDEAFLDQMLAERDREEKVETATNAA